MINIDLNLQIFLWIYILIVTVFIVFDALIKMRMKQYPAREKKIKRHWTALFDQCLQSGNYTFPILDTRRLHSSEWLQGFYASYNDVFARDERIKDVVEANEKEIFHQCSRYPKNNTTLRAYFAYFCSGIQINDPDDNNEYTKLMLEYLTDHSIFCHENALKALYSFGNVDAVVEAFQILSRHRIYHSEKLLTNGLLTFNGNQDELADALMKHFDEYSKCCRIGIIDYLRYSSNSRYDAKILTILQDSKEDNDLRCCSIRELNKTQSPAFYAEIEKILRDYNNENWEVTTVAAKAAGRMKQEKMQYLLADSLSSKYWYVRMNSAKSLVALGVDDDMMQKIQQKGDRYAEEALMYELERKEEETCGIPS